MKKIFSVFLLISLIVGGCSVYKTIVNISRLKFKFGRVNNFKIGKIELSNKTKLRDVNPINIIKLTAQIARKKLPVSFTLYIEAKNPNNGTEGFAPTDIVIKSFPWKFFINNKKIVSGNINSPITIPGKGHIKIIHLIIRANLYKISKNNNIKNILKTALAIGGAKGSSSKLKLIVQPVIGTKLFGEIKYPKPITIVNYKFN